MRLLTIFTAIAFLAVFPALAQDDASLYRVADVTADVTAASAPVAREHAIMQAQRIAFASLLERLGADAPEAKASDEALASLVQSFDIQKEHAAGLRYTGTFSVQFKPMAVRQWLDGVGVPFSEARPQPVVILPITKTDDQTVLWEDMTPWRLAWLEGAKSAGLVPLIVPAGELEDIALISTTEALSGKPEALKAVMEKYGAGAVLIAVLEDKGAEASAEKQTGEKQASARIETRRYDRAGSPVEPKQAEVHWASPKQKESALAEAVHEIVKSQDRVWRKENKVPTGAVIRLPVDVAVPTLAAFAQMRQRLTSTAAVAGVEVVSMTRGLVHVELAYRGEIDALQGELKAQGLLLDQGPEGGWLLRQIVVE